MAEDENSGQQFQRLLEQLNSISELHSIGQDQASPGGLDQNAYLQQLEKKKEKIMWMMAQLQASNPGPLPPSLPPRSAPPSGNSTDIYQNIGHLVNVGALSSSSSSQFDSKGNFS